MVQRVHVDISTTAAKHLLRTAEAQRYIEQVAEQVAQIAHDIAPVGRTGQTAESYVAGGAEVRHGSAVASVGSTSGIWHIIEFGSVHNPPYRVMQRACELAGLEVHIT